MKPDARRPFVFINMAMTADGKIAPASRRFAPFGGERDAVRLLELRATADAILCGARTLESSPITLGPGPEKYRALRLRRGLAEYPLRVIASGTAGIDPDAEIFRHRFSPVLLLTTARAPKKRLETLRSLEVEVHICGDKTVDFEEALRWLHREWKVKRLLCEGGGELNGALFRAGLVDELHLTICPSLLGGRRAPTIADGIGAARLADAAPLRIQSIRRAGGELFLTCAVCRPERAED